MKTLRALPLVVIVLLFFGAGMAFALSQNVTTAISPVGSYGQVVVDNTATLILAAGNRVSVTIRNVGSTDVYIGFDNTVTTATGFLLRTSGKESITLDRTTSAIYGICASDNTTISYVKE